MGQGPQSGGLKPPSFLRTVFADTASAGAVAAPVGYFSQEATAMKSIRRF